MILHDGGNGAWDSVDDALQQNFSVTPAHPDVTYGWYQHATDVPADHVALEVVGVATRTYGEDFVFWFPRQ